MSGLLPGCPDARITGPTVSNWKVGKPNSWDPLLETGELREELEKRQQFAVPGDSSSQVVRARYPFKEDLVNSPGKWTTADEGIQYLRELAVPEVIYSDLDNDEVYKDPEDVLCTRAMWKNMIQSAQCHILTVWQRCFARMWIQQLWRECLLGSKTLKKISVPPHPYGPAPWLSGAPQEVSPLLPQSEGKGTPGACRVVHPGSSCVTRGRT